MAVAMVASLLCVYASALPHGETESVHTTRASNTPDATTHDMKSVVSAGTREEEVTLFYNSSTKRFLFVRRALLSLRGLYTVPSRTFAI